MRSSKPSGTSPSFFWLCTLMQRMKWSSSSSPSSLSNSSSSTSASTAPPHLVDASLAIATKSESHRSTRPTTIIVDSSTKKNQQQQLLIAPAPATAVAATFLTWTRRRCFIEVGLALCHVSN